MDIPITMCSLLTYEIVDDYITRRAPHREQHLHLVMEFRARGEFVMGGVVGDPPERALIVFRGDRSVAEAFAGKDPYVQNGLVRQWYVQPWPAVLGESLDNLPDSPS